MTHPGYTRTHAWLHGLAVTLAVGTVLLIGYGGLVHSAGAGLSVPDWPTTYGENMFTFPVAKWQGGIVYEHGHRLLASGIGFITIILAIAVWMKDERRWMKWLAGVALLAVIVQGVLGGLTVLMRLPTAVSVSHAIVAQSFMIMTVAMAAATSRRWRTAPAAAESAADRSLQQLLLATAVFSLVQILLGAVTRHTYSGMAIVDFPLNNGQIIPAFTSFGVGIQFAHRVGAAVLSVLVFWQGIRVLRSGLDRLRRPAVFAMLMIVLQVLLGATVIWTREAVIPNTLHVAGGAVTFALTFLTWFFSTRYYRFAGRARRAEDVRIQGARA